MAQALLFAAGLWQVGDAGFVAGTILKESKPSYQADCFGSRSFEYPLVRFSKRSFFETIQLSECRAQFPIRTRILIATNFALTISGDCLMLVPLNNEFSTMKIG
jgi:hypothetical protein